MIYFKYSIWWIHANFSLYMLVHISKHLSVFHNAMLFHSWKKYNFQIHFICLSVFFSFGGGGGWLSVKLAKLQWTFGSLQYFSQHYTCILTSLSWTQWNLKKTLRYLMICNVITQWLPQDLKLTSKYLWYSGYHNVCNIRVQTIYTYKNLNNSGEKW